MLKNAMRVAAGERQKIAKLVLQRERQLLSLFYSAGGQKALVLISIFAKKL